MTTFTIQTYQIMAFAGPGEPVRVYLRDETGKYRGYIDFVEEFSSSKKFVVHSNGIVNAFMSLGQLHAMLDVLRNEEPVYFAANEAYNWAAIKTGAEPTGEEETP